VLPATHLSHLHLENPYLDRFDYAKNDTTMQSMKLEMTLSARYTLAQYAQH